MSGGFAYGATDWTVGPICLDDFVTVLAEYPEDHRWNGWLCPAMDAWSVEVVLAALEADEFNERNLRHDWDGDVLVTTEDGDGEDADYVERYEPTADGLYSLGAYAWVWSKDEDEVAEIYSAECLGCGKVETDRGALLLWNGYGSGCSCLDEPDSLWRFFDGRVVRATKDGSNVEEVVR